MASVVYPAVCSCEVRHGGGGGGEGGGYNRGGACTRSKHESLIRNYPLQILFFLKSWSGVNEAMSGTSVSEQSRQTRSHHAKGYEKWTPCPISQLDHPLSTEGWLSWRDEGRVGRWVHCGVCLRGCQELWMVDAWGGRRTEPRVGDKKEGISQENHVKALAGSALFRKPCGRCSDCCGKPFKVWKAFVVLKAWRHWLSRKNHSTIQC